MQLLMRDENLEYLKDKIILNRLNNDFKSLYDLQVSKSSKFLDDYWDFTESNELFQSPDLFKYDFRNIDYVFKDYLKITILNNLLFKEVAFSTLKSLFIEIQIFIKYLSNHHYYAYELIDEECILGFFNEKNISVQHEVSLKHSIKTLLMEIECRNNNISFINCYKVLDAYDRRKYKIEKEEGKFKLIPSHVHEQIISLAMKDIKNDYLGLIDRMSACMLVIIAETGMRIGEFTLLKEKNLKAIKFDEDNKEFYYLKFITYKTTQAKYKRTKTFMTDKAVVAFKTLVRLLNGYRDSNGFLYINTRSGSKYVGATTHKQHLYRFFIRHQSELGFHNMNENDLSKFHVLQPNESLIKGISFLSKDDINKKFYYVTFHQFRVYVATALYNQNYHLDWIREHMNHLADTMTEHYIRIKDDEDRSKNAVEMLLNRSNEEGTALETDFNKIEDAQIKNELNKEEFTKAYESINKFLKKRKLNIFSDMKTIISMLQKNNAPLLDAELGVCAKSFNKLCERHEYLSSRNDFYNIGVYIPDFINLDYTYKVFKEKEEIIKYNKTLCDKNEKYLNEYTREIKSIKHYIKKRLYPELVLLEKELKKSGNLLVATNNPNLKNIINSFPKIKEEVNSWKKVN